MKSFRDCWIVCLAVALPLAVVADDAAMLRQMRDAGVLNEAEYRKLAPEENVRPEKVYSSTSFRLGIAGPVALPWGSDWDVHGFGFGLPVLQCHDFSGVGFGLLQGVYGKLSGVQIGIINYVEKGAGLQMGIANIGEEFCGVQIGLINLNSSADLPCCPLISMRF